MAVSLGYTNVFYYKAGLPDWIRRRYPVSRTVDYPKADIPKITAKELSEQLDQFVILDIRGTDTKSIGDIEQGTVFQIPIEDLEEKYSDLPKDKTIVIADLTGVQQDIAGKFLILKGYKNVISLNGGALAWFKMMRVIDKTKGEKHQKNNQENT